MEINNLLQELNINPNKQGCNAGGIWHGDGEALSSYSPVNGSLL